MHNHVENVTPPESPSKGDSPGATTVEQIGRLSLDNTQPKAAVQGRTGRGMLNASPVTASKRAASSELPRSPIRQAPASTAGNRYGQPAGLRNPRTANRPYRARGSNPRQSSFGSYPTNGSHQTMPGTSLSQDSTDGYYAGKPAAVPRDSGYGTMPSSRTTTLLPNPKADAAGVTGGFPATRAFSYAETASNNQLTQQRTSNVIQLPEKARYPGLILQPDSSPISQDQLAAEVKGIYAGLVMVEAKCINIDAAQAADPNSQLGPEQWQALIALHRTLLYEHHDFLMATQHPSATPALRGLATKYSKQIDKQDPPHV